MATKKRGGKKRRASKRASKRTTKRATVTIRMANEASMAARKHTKRHHRRRSNPPRRHHRRRRSNPGGFLERAGRLLGLGAVAVGTGVGVTYAASKISPGSNVAMYGIPAIAFLAGAAISQKMPTLGVGMAAGALSPFVIPITTKLMTATTPSTPATTAAGIARAYRTLRAVDMGAGRMLRGIDMGAVDMGANHPAYVAYR